MQSKRFLKSLGAASLLVAVSAQSHAAGLADLAGGLNEADITAGMTAVALVIAGVLAARMGIRKVLGMIK
ncbi:hypothetical protein D3C78_1622800 [compost metagenome]